MALSLAQWRPSPACGSGYSAKQLRQPSSLEAGRDTSRRSNVSRRPHAPARMRAARDQDRPAAAGAGSPRGFGAPSLQSEASSGAPPRGGTSKGEEGPSRRTPEDQAFEDRLAAIRQAAAGKKKSAESRLYSPIDYDNPEEDTSGAAGLVTKDLGSKIGIGVAATVFAAIFAFGDILPPPAPPPPSVPDSSSSFSGQMNTLPPEKRQVYEAQVRELEATLASAPNDRVALEGASVLYVELGALPRADQLLTRLEKVAPGDLEVVRLHAEVQYALGEYGASSASYRRALEQSGSSVSVELLQGLSESLIAENKPREAVNELLEVRKQTLPSLAADSPTGDLDPVQVELLLGKSYLAWGKPGDAVAVYDSLISARPEDFRGYLAKALLLQAQGKDGDAQRMFLQAKFLAPDAAKGLVDRLARKQR